jgi:hypothetical protein
MFAQCQMGGQAMGFPDVCLTPAPPAPSPVPIPYPNIALGLQGIGFVAGVLIFGGPAHNLNTKIVMSSCDEPGVAGGVVSHLIKGPCRYVTGAFSVLVHGAPLARLTTVTIHNKDNACPGALIVPAQTGVIVLAP